MEGFRLLAARIGDAIASTGEPDAQARLVAQAYLAFATESANLVDIMFRHGADGDRDARGRSATAAFEPLLHVFERAERDGLVHGGDAATAATLFLAALQGIAALVNCGVVPPTAIPRLVDDAVPRFIGPGVSRPR